MTNRFVRLAVLAASFVGFASRASIGQSPSRGATPKDQPPRTAAQRRALLLDPTRAFWSTRAPDTFTADIETSRGTITIELTRVWAPSGVDHFYNLARAGYYDDSRFFRVLYGFVAQFGIAGDPTIANLWGSRRIPSDPVRE